MRYKGKMPLKAFWEEVEQRLTRYSAAELRNILRAMAEETPPGERQAFLDKLKLKKKTTAGVQKVLQQEDLLADIDDLTRELRAEMKQADYYWDPVRVKGSDAPGFFSPIVNFLSGLRPFTSHLSTNFTTVTPVPPSQNSAVRNDSTRGCFASSACTAWRRVPVPLP